MRRSVLAVTALAVVLGAAPACADKTAGSPLPDGSAGTSTGSATTTTSRGTTSTRPTSGGTSPLAGKNPCTLLTASAQAQLGVSNGSKNDVGRSRGCRWTQRAQSGDLLILNVGILDKDGIKDLPGDVGAKSLPDIGKHKAIQATGLGGQGSCVVVLGVTDSSRVEVGSIAGTDQQKACDLAMQAAKLVEPELP